MLYNLCVLMFMVGVYYCLSPLLTSLAWQLGATGACVVAGIFLCLPKYRVISVHERTDQEILQQNIRSVGIDFVKTIAVVLVFTFHFLFAVGFYQMRLEGAGMFVKTWIRWASAVCVPLFIVTTGYLQGTKKPTRGYYLKFAFPVSSYLLNACLLIIYLRICYGSISLDILRGLVNLDLYWYINMYFGLYLMIPLLNLAWNPFDKKGQEIILVTLTILTSLCTVTNGWTTGYWPALYPVLLYYTGAFIRRYRVQCSRWLLGVIYLAASLLAAIKCYFTLHGGVFQWNLFGAFCNEYNSLLVIGATVSLFLLCYEFKSRTKWLIRLLRYVAVSTLEIYLLTVTNFGSQFSYFFVRYLPNTHVIVVYGIALSMSMFFNTLLGYWLHKLSTRMGNRLILVIERKNKLKAI